MPMPIWTPTRNSGSCFRQIFFVVWCLAAAAASSDSRGRSREGNNDCANLWADDDSSSNHASVSNDEEQVISALALLHEEVKPRTHYRPKTRGLTPSKKMLDDLPCEDKPRIRRRRRRRKRQVRKKRKSLGTATKERNEKPRIPLDSQNTISPSMTTPKLVDPVANEMKELKQRLGLWETYPTVSGDVLESTVSTHHTAALAADLGSDIQPVLEIVPPRPSSPSLGPKNHPTHVNNVPIPPVSSSTTSWVRRYLNSRTKDVLLPVPKEYIADGFNLAQLAPIVERIGFQAMGTQALEVAKRLVELPAPQPSFPIYRLALQLLLNENEAEEATILTHPVIPPHAIQHATEALYLIVHARFVTSPRGLDALRRILLNSPVFGKCPRPQCQGTMLLPYGVSNDFTSNSHICQRYCACCGNVWNCWESKTDGCAWGPSLCFLLLMAHGHELFPAAADRQISSEMLRHPNDPRVFGFRIHPAASWGHPLSG